MNPDLSASALRLSLHDMIAVAGVVHSGQQKIAPAVVAAPGCIVNHQAMVKIHIEKMRKIWGCANGWGLLGMSWKTPDC